MAVVAEGSIFHDEKVLLSLKPDGALDGMPTYEVMSGNSTTEANPDDATGMSTYLVSETLADGVDQADTTYSVKGDVDFGTGTQFIEEEVVLHVRRRGATSLGAGFGMPVPKV